VLFRSRGAGAKTAHAHVSTATASIATDTAPARRGAIVAASAKPSGITNGAPTRATEQLSKKFIPQSYCSVTFLKNR
jgi:hypothetical protein